MSIDNYFKVTSAPGIDQKLVVRTFGFDSKDAESTRFAHDAAVAVRSASRGGKLAVWRKVLRYPSVLAVGEVARSAEYVPAGAT